MKRGVFVSGLGAITSVGDSVAEFWSNCLDGKTVVENIPEHWHRIWKPKSNVICPLVLPNYRKEGFKGFELLQNDPVTLNSILATKEALNHASINYSISEENRTRYSIDTQVPAERIGVFLGTGAGGNQSLLNNAASALAISQRKFLVDEVLDEDFDFKEIESQFFSGKYSFNTFSLPMYLHNCVASALACKFSVRGPVEVAVYACASSTIAIGNAYEALKNGKIDIAICGGSEYVHDYCGNTFHSFDAINALTTYEGKPEQSSRPFDKDRANFLFSQGGCGILILESKDSIESRGVNPVCEIVGYENNFDCHHFMQPEPNGAQVKLLIQALLRNAQLLPSDIGYINAHGTGTELNDKIESQLIQELFGDNPLVNSTKSIIGHTLGACGALESIVTALTLSNKITHPSINLDNPIADLNFARKKTQIDTQHGLNLSYAFGGQNAGLLFKQC